MMHMISVAVAITIHKQVSKYVDNGILRVEKDAIYITQSTVTPGQAVGEKKRGKLSH